MYQIEVNIQPAGAVQRAELLHDMQRIRGLVKGTVTRAGPEVYALFHINGRRAAKRLGRLKKYGQVSVDCYPLYPKETNNAEHARAGSHA